MDVVVILFLVKKCFTCFFLEFKNYFDLAYFYCGSLVNGLIEFLKYFFSCKSWMFNKCYNEICKCLFFKYISILFKIIYVVYMWDAVVTQNFNFSLFPSIE